MLFDCFSWSCGQVRNFAILPRGERMKTVVALHDQGMSNVAIAKATGVSEWTVRSDLAGCTNVQPDPNAKNSQHVTASDLASFSAIESLCP